MHPNHNGIGAAAATAPKYNPKLWSRRVLPCAKGASERATAKVVNHFLLRSKGSNNIDITIEYNKIKRMKNTEIPLLGRQQYNDNRPYLHCSRIQALRFFLLHKSTVSFSSFIIIVLFFFCCFVRLKNKTWHVLSPPMAQPQTPADQKLYANCLPVCRGDHAWQRCNGPKWY